MPKLELVATVTHFGETVSLELPAGSKIYVERPAKPIILSLTEEEAQVLLTLGNFIGGDQTGYRGQIESIMTKLRNLDVGFVPGYLAGGTYEFVTKDSPKGSLYLVVPQNKPLV